MIVTGAPVSIIRAARLLLIEAGTKRWFSNRRSSFTPASPCPERKPARVPGCCCDCAVKGASTTADRIKANNFFMGGLLTCRCFARLLLLNTISAHLNHLGGGRISPSILIARARKLLVISEHLNTGEVQSPTVARWPVKSS